MLMPTIVSLAIWARAPMVLVALGVLAVWNPVLILVMAAAWAVWSHQRRRRAVDPDAESDFLRAIASEARAGAAPRVALAAAIERVPRLGLEHAGRMALAGLPIDRVASSVATALPDGGTLVAAALRLASTSGGRLAGLMDRLAVHAAERGRLERERRALTAQARLSAGVVGVLPLALVGLLTATGRLPSLTGTAGVVAVVGIGMQAAGGAVVWVMVRRAAR